MRRPAGDEEEERGQATVCLAPFGPMSFVKLTSRRAVGIGYDGRKIGRKKVDCVPEICLPHAKHVLPHCCPNGVHREMELGVP